MKEVICAWKRMEEERADLEGWMAGTEEELKKMERSPTEEVKELTGQVNRIGVSPIHQQDANRIVWDFCIIVPHAHRDIFDL